MRLSTDGHCRRLFPLMVRRAQPVSCPVTQIFSPATPWPRGRYQLVIQNTIEDLAGNNIGKSFEVDLFDNVQPRIAGATVKLSFEVR